MASSPDLAALKADLIAKREASRLADVAAEQDWESEERWDARSNAYRAFLDADRAYCKAIADKHGIE